MYLHDAVVDSQATTTFGQDDWVFEVGGSTSLLCVDTDHAQLFPDFGQENIKTELHMYRDASIQWILRYLVDLLNRDGIDLVVDINALYVLSIALNHIDELVDIVVSPEGNMSIMHLVLVHDVDHHLFVNFGQLAVSVELNSTGFDLLDADIGPTLVQTDANLFEFLGEFSFLLFSFLAVEDHEDDICGLSDSDNLLSSTLTVSSTLDNTGQI